MCIKCIVLLGLVNFTLLASPLMKSRSDAAYFEKIPTLPSKICYGRNDFGYHPFDVLLVKITALK
jgi:hypothetical protein